MERTRLAGVHGERHGSGYLVAPGLVLTSAHVVGAGPVTVFRPGRPGTTTGTVVWSGTPGGRDDAALVRVAEDFTEQGAPVRWGRAVTDRTGIECAAWGLPDVVQLTDAVEVKQVRGHLNAGDRFVGNRYAMAVDGPAYTGDSPWAGMSGAPLFAGHLLIGVVAADAARGGHGELLAVPAYVLWHDPEFLAALAPDADRLAPVELDDGVRPHRITTPSTLLVAAKEVVPWQPRPELMAELHAWLDDDGSPVRLVHGPGGQGKTRLALQLAHELPASWAVWWPGPDAAGFDAVGGLRVPTLIVVDYAETRVAQLTALLLAASAAAKVKVLLLARICGSWWDDELLAADGEVTDLLHTARAHALPPLGDGDPYRAAVTAFAPHVPGADPAALAERHPRAEHVLTLHMTALADLLDQAEPLDANGMSAEERVLVHERHYWLEAAGGHRLTDLPPGLLGDAVAVASLVGSADRAALRSLPDLADQPNLTLSKLVAWLVALYPGTGALQPDRLAERHVAARVTRNASLLPELVDVVTADQAATLLTVLTRAAASTDLDAQIVDAVMARPDPLVAAAVEVVAAVERPEPLLDALARFATAPDTSYRQIADLGLAIPRFSQRLAPVAHLVAERRVAMLRAGDQGYADPDTELAFALHDLGNCLRRLGSREDALAATEAAVSIRRRLAESGSTGSLRDLASSLTSLGNRLDELGRTEDALAALDEAVGIRRELAKDPELRSGLASSLNGFAAQLSESGMPEEALAAQEEAVRIDRRIAEQRPDSLPSLATSLSNLGVQLGELGRNEEALSALGEALGIDRRLAEDRPDEFLPSLATCLHNYAGRLADVGRADEALAAVLEAVSIRRGLASVRPDAFLPNLASSLNSLSGRLADVGQRDEALAVVLEAVSIRRGLAEARPDAFLPDLASSLNRLSGRLADAGERDEALAAVREAVDLWRGLAGARPAAFLRDLSTSLNNLAVRLGALGRRAEALAAIEESVGIDRRLAESRPATSLPDLAVGLRNLAINLREVGRRDEAVAAAEEAVRIGRRFALPGLARGLDTLANSLVEAGRGDEALVVAEELVDLHRRLGDETTYQQALRLRNRLRESGPPPSPRS